ncbi:hypothetical protein TRFO_37328 [Tritrichomonas foetus]|uniref:Uncharacterized protein n=1 Tax=Tritrichomonas foetus TaxID=1144522 RepID=A0A1J4JBA2_9EUKA|nr:hypothetical protein TRFO_37328 [Tritrichomonas foetus]|eukprot:OHS96474.1 hypothetical protein TRFO_37328 [Tritrichomonas foetus]
MSKKDVRNATLHNTGLPWVIIKPIKRNLKSRSNSVSRDLNIPGNTQTPPKKPERQLPFLAHSSIGFNEDEISTINDSLNIDPQANIMYKTPSRLQQIKLTHFESAQKPLAMDIDTSTPYFVPTATGNTLDLERDGSLISLNGEEDLSTQIMQKNSFIMSNPSQSISDLVIRDEPVLSSEVQNQVWIYCHNNKQDGEKTVAVPFSGCITDNLATESPSKGRKRLLRAIHKVADSSGADKYEPVKERRIKAPIESTYTGQSFALYLEENDVPIPNFLHAK